MSTKRLHTVGAPQGPTDIRMGMAVRCQTHVKMFGDGDPKTFQAPVTVTSKNFFIMYDVIDTGLGEKGFFFFRCRLCNASWSQSILPGALRRKCQSFPLTTGRTLWSA